MLAATKFHQPNGEAHLISPYILAGHDTCIKFYYQLRGGILNIRVRHQAGGFETVWSRRYTCVSLNDVGILDYLLMTSSYYRLF